MDDTDMAMSAYGLLVYDQPNQRRSSTQWRIKKMSLGGRNFVPARWRHNMAPRGRMLSFSQQLFHLNSSIAVEL